MATSVLVSPEDYLATSFEGPEREYVDGRVVERNAGENPHSEVQARLIEIFYELRKKLPLYCRLGASLQTRPHALPHPRRCSLSSRQAHSAGPR